MRVFFTILILGIPFALSGQSYTPEDSVEIQQALRATYFIESDSPEAAMARYDSLHQVSLDKGYTIGAGRGRMYKGIVLNDLGRYDEAVEHYQQALPFFENARFDWGIAGIHNNLGVTYNLRGHFDSAATHYMQALERYDQLGDTNVQLVIYGNVGGIFMELNQIDKAQQYFEYGLNLAKAFADSVRLADAHINMGYLYTKQSDLNAAEEQYKAALILGEGLGNAYITYLAANNLSDLHYQNEDWERSAAFGRKALYNARLTDNPFHVVNATNNLGLRFTQINKNDSAVLLLRQSIALATELGQQRLAADGYLYLADAYHKLNRQVDAFESLKAHLQLFTSLRSERQDKLVNELEAKYQSAQKDREIAEKNLNIAQAEARTGRQRTMLIVFAAALLVLVLIGVIFYRNTKQKERLQKERLLRVEQEQALKQLRARMEGEELERQRLARELHDGIGGQLAMISAQMNNGNGADGINGISESLRNTDAEVRRIAHNLMPEILMKHGLKMALTAFAEQMNGHPHPIEMQWTGPDIKLDDNTELAVYRIAQELVKNALKHAKPKSIFIQVMVSDTELHLTVEDDGVGMTKSAHHGIGMANIKERLMAVGGSIEFDGSPGKGTTAMVALPLNIKVL